MSAFHIRSLCQNDNPIIAGIIRTVLTEFKANKPGTVYFDPTTDDLFSLFGHQRSKYYILEIGDTIAGGAGIFPTEGLPDGYCELVKLYLLKEHRGKGFGKMLIERCFDAAKDAGFTHMYLETMPELKNAMDLYGRCGFRGLEGPLGNSGHFGCGLWMVKEL